MDVPICDKCGGEVEREFAEVEGNDTCSGCLITVARLETGKTPSYNEVLGQLREPKTKPKSTTTDDGNPPEE